MRSVWLSWWIAMVVTLCGTMDAEGRKNKNESKEIAKASLTKTSILSALSAFQLLQMKIALVSLILAGVYVFWYKLFPDELMKMEDPNYDPMGSTFQGLL